jgi:senataxin
LSSAGSERLEKYKGQFACLIVDEAGQCTEPNLLIAFQLNITKVLLIGDPCQLPATTFSPDSNITLFNRSMFERMIDGGLKPYFLDIQYRMSPQIRYFPSKCFYNGRLTDDYSVRNRLYPNEIRTFANSNLMFLDVKFGSEKKVDKSYENDAEANVTLNLIAELKAHQLKIGVITPYKQQMRKLQNSLRSYPNVFTNTIDSFQGQEKDIIIISCVRSSSNCSHQCSSYPQ